ncbi:MAG: RDD family protein [Saccharofermentanales bacterium]
MEINNKVNQYPDYFYAGFWIRFLAYIVDLLMIGSIVRFINGPLSIFTKGVNEISIWHLSIGAAVIVYPLYFVLFTKFTGGQTLGKIIFGIRVVSFTEYEMTWKTVIIRELFGRYIQKTLLFLYLIVAVTPKKQHIADMLTDTGVISENHLEAFRYGMKLSRSLSADEQAQPLPPPKLPHTPQAQADTSQERERNQEERNQEPLPR